MNAESKRLFISDLPEGLAEDDLNGKFSNYGNVTSVEIKQRKDVSSKNSTDRFAYVNVDIDHASLQQCFEEFSRKKWKGHYINIQLAKESFLDRLKREREEANKSQSSSEPPTNGISKTVANVEIKTTENNTPKPAAKKPTKQDSSSSESSSDSEDEKPPVVKKQVVIKAKEESSSSESSSDSEEEREAANRRKEEITKVYEDVVVKNNRNKKFTKNIESVGKEPIITIEKKKPKSKDPSRTQADQKRIKSMQEMKRGYDKQKSAIKMALAKVDVQKNNKIIFDNDDNNDVTQEEEEVQSNNKRKMSNGDAHEENANKKGKMSLFEEDSDDEADDDGHKINFEVKKQFEGKKGQKLMELQTKFKSDHRFQMDERFLEEDDEEEEDYEEKSEDKEEDTIEDSNENIDDKVTLQEKQQQLEILEQVLGKKVTKLTTPASESTNKSRKSMLRFDPDQPEHLKYEVHEEKNDKAEKKKKKKRDAEAEEAKEQLPEVSKETFYEVKDAFKPIAKTTEDAGFSLLSMFGRAADDDDNKDVDESMEADTDGPREEANTEPKKKAKSIDTHNPFKYDSSDDERDEKREIADKTKEKSNVDEIKSVQLEPAPQRINLGGKKLWTEPFFFTNDDYRFQEGIDFIKKLENKEDTEFVQLRRDIKMIVRDKFMHNQKKNKMFKKKLGGGKGKFKKTFKKKNMRTQKTK